MRFGHFAALVPVCPRCLHTRGVTSPLVIAHQLVVEDDHLVQGILHCSDPACWQEFPVIDGAPILVPDPAGYLARTAEQILARADLDPMIESLVGDALGPGTGFDTTRQHLSLYARDHFGDWAGLVSPSQVAATLAEALALAGEVTGPVIDVGASVGRGVWELAARVPGLVLGGDLNFAMVRLGQSLLRRGEGRFPQRRGGLVYDQMTASAPSAPQVDLWVMDAMALPFAPGSFGVAAAINLIDCVPGPQHLLGELARILAPGGAALIATPYDWAANATPPAAWLGGHSQRGPGGGDSPAALRAALDAAGFDLAGAAADLPWSLIVHDRATMFYTLDLVAARRR